MAAKGERVAAWATLTVGLGVMALATVVALSPAGMGVPQSAMLRAFAGGGVLALAGCLWAGRRS